MTSQENGGRAGRLGQARQRPTSVLAVDVGSSQLGRRQFMGRRVYRNPETVSDREAVDAAWLDRSSSGSQTAREGANAPITTSLPTAKSQTKPNERQQLRRLVERRGLCGLANNTQWDEFISAMRAREGWTPQFRFKCIDGQPVCWDTEWCYHLPFPMMAAEWFDLTFLQEIREPGLPPRTARVDHSPWIEDLIRRIGLDYEKGSKMIRIFGYSPKDYGLFDDASK